MNALAAGMSALLYLVATLLLLLRLRPNHQGQATERTMALLCALLAVFCHTELLRQNVFTPAGMNLGLFNAASLFGWQISLVLILISARLPVENLGLILFPFTALTVGVGAAFTDSSYAIHPYNGWLDAHILLSILAYSLLAMAVTQSLLVFLQDRLLRRHQPVAWMRALPPLQTMEELLFRMLGLGFLLLSLALLSGLMFVHNLFGQHLAHKMILSFIAWLIFGMLLWGHWRHGWRGKIAVRWTLSGGFALTLAYFGSKFVLELLLGRQWG